MKTSTFLLVGGPSSVSVLVAFSGLEGRYFRELGRVGPRLLFGFKINKQSHSYSWPVPINN